MLVGRGCPVTEPRACRGCTPHRDHEARCEVMVEHNNEPGNWTSWAQYRCERRKKR